MQWGLAYECQTDGHVFDGCRCVVLSTWSADGPLPLLQTQIEAVREKGRITSVDRAFGNRMKLVPEEVAWRLAKDMANHVGRQFTAPAELRQTLPCTP